MLFGLIGCVKSELRHAWRHLGVFFQPSQQIHGVGVAADQSGRDAVILEEF